MTAAAPLWAPDRAITIAQLATGVREYREAVTAPEGISLPYPDNLQTALNRITLLCQQHAVRPPHGVVELLRWAERPFADWPAALVPDDVDLDEALVVFGAPSQSCLELGALRGDVEAEIRENRLMRAVMGKTRDHGAQRSYVAFRRLLIEQPAMSALELEKHLGRSELALLSTELRQAYLPVPPEAVADGLVRTCAGCRGLRLPVEHDWQCVDLSCPDPHRAGPDLPAVEGAVWLRRELRMFVTVPGRAELRIAAGLTRRDVPFELWPDFDTFDLSVFTERPWLVDVKAWRNPARLGRHLRSKPIFVPATAERGFVVVAAEETRRSQRYVERLCGACPGLGRGRLEALSERQFLMRVDRRHRGER